MYVTPQHHEVDFSLTHKAESRIVRVWKRKFLSTKYPSGHVTDPKGPLSGRGRVLRGGGWDYNAGYCRSAGRYWDIPGYRDNFIGFRFARDFWLPLIPLPLGVQGLASARRKFLSEWKSSLKITTGLIPLQRPMTYNVHILYRSRPSLRFCILLLVISQVVTRELSNTVCNLPYQPR